MSPEEKPFKPLWSGLMAGSWPFLFGFLFAGLLEFWRGLASRTIFMLRETWDAFPNPWRMADAIVTFATSIVGMAITAPFNAQKQAILRELKAQKLSNRLIRVDDAVDGIFNALILGIKQVTFTSETGLIGFIAGGLAKFLWKLAKRIKLLRVLIKVRTEQELIELVIRVVSRKLHFVRVLALVMGLYLIVVAIVATGAMMLFALNFGEFYAYLLPQDSKRERSPHESTQRRVNLRKGKDSQ